MSLKCYSEQSKLVNWEVLKSKPLVGISVFSKKLGRLIFNSAVTPRTLNSRCIFNNLLYS